MAPSFKFNPEYLHSQKGSMGNWGSETQTTTVGAESCPPEPGSFPVFDPVIPDMAQEFKSGWRHSWEVKMTTKRDVIDLAENDIWKKLASNLTSSKTLWNTEVHVMWISMLPTTAFQEDIKVSLEFTQTEDEDKQLLGTCSFPAGQYVHCIFFPAHSVVLGSSPLPWRIVVDSSNLSVKADYVYARCYVRITGVSGMIPVYESIKEARMVALMPTDEPVAGTAMTRPRLVKEEWMKTYVKRGVGYRVSHEKVTLLQVLGFDIEGLVLLKILGKILKEIPAEYTKRPGDLEVKRGVADIVGRATKK